VAAVHTITMKLKAESPLLMHSDRFSDPLDPMTKEHKALTSKRKKTEEDLEAVAKSEYMGGLYWDEELGPYMPGQNVKSCLVGAAKLNRLGAQFKRALIVPDERIRLEYPGPRDPEKLWETRKHVDARSVVVSQSRLMRYRPKFHDWSLTATVIYSPEMLDHDNVIRAAENAGMFIGLGDYRAEKGGAFGRFSVEVLGYE
jgi:hypothetical protein